MTISNTPRRKRKNRKDRIHSAKARIRTYKGKNIVKGYAKWFGVDLVCAITELRMVDITISPEYEKKVKHSIKQQKIENNLRLENQKTVNQEREKEYSNNQFAYIAGYTSGGAAFGLTHEEMKKIQNKQK